MKTKIIKCFICKKELKVGLRSPNNKVCRECKKNHHIRLYTKEIICKKCSKKFIASAYIKNDSLCEECKREQLTHICEKCGKKFIRYFKSDRKKHCSNCIRKVEHNIQKPQKFSQLSKRTISKIMKRLIRYENIGCSNCGWNEAVGDIHHINGKKIKNFDDHTNLCYLCPNCHRLVHSNMLKKEELLSIENQFGNIWQKYYGKTFLKNIR